MFKKFLIIIIVIVTALYGCSGHGGKEKSPIVQEAYRMADTMSNTDELYRNVLKYKKMGETTAELIFRQKYGKTLRDKSLFEDAIRQHDTCIAMARELDDTILLIMALNNQGTNFRRLGIMTEATDLHYEALRLCDYIDSGRDMEVKKIKTRTLNGLGNVLLSLKNYEAAESYFRQAYNDEAMANNPTGLAINLANIGSIKEYQGDLDSALIYYNLSLEYNRACNNQIGISLCYKYLGKLAERRGHKGEALKFYQQGYNIGYPTGDAWHWLEPSIAMIGLYIDEHQTDSAKKYIEQGLKKAYEIHSIDHLARLHELRARLYEQNGDPVNALKDYHVSRAYGDSVALEKSQNYIQNIRVNYEANKAKLAEDKAETEKTIRNHVVYSALAIVVLTIALFLFMFRWIKERRKAARSLELMDRERQEFYRGVTHQLRTPLTVVLGMTQQLQKYLPADSQIAQREFQALDRHCRNLLTLVTEMIEYSKNGNTKTNVLSEFVQTPAESESEMVERIAADDYVKTNRAAEGGEDADGKKYVLVAEDNPDVALLVCEMLKDEGYYYAWARDGQEAWELLHNNKMPDLLVTDVMMPRMNGLELMKKIRADESISHLPIIVVSARVENDDRLAGVEAGAEVYLGKPFETKELLLRIRKLLEQREILRNKIAASITQRMNVEATKKAADTAAPANVAEPVAAAPVAEQPKGAAEAAEVKDGEIRLTTRERQFIEKIDKTIIQNLADTGFSSAALADLMGTTTGTLNRKLKNYTNIDTTHYIRMHRVEKAKRMLTDIDISIVEVQIECGFETPSYFSRVFKADVGMSPSEYRRLHGRY
ncbi:MAG: response regulator [Bacteroidaceae bacterium]|nr:response regulator [Bacteroidaceae bacterium]